MSDIINIGNDAAPASGGAMAIVDGYTQKIDNLATDGLSGVSNSLSFRVEELEKHFHNVEKWFGAAAVPSGEIHTADEMDGAIAPFQLVAGNNDFNATWTQILGSSDLPVMPGMTKADAHRILVTTTNSTNAFVIQIVIGESSDIAAKLLAKDYNVVPFISATNNADSGITDIISKRITAGTKVWARCACVGANGTNINFYIGIHEYIA